MPLDPETVQELRTALERQLARLERSLSLGEASTRPVELDQQAVGRLSRMDSLQNQHMSRSLQGRQEAEHAATRAALRRMDDGEYGICTACGQPIDPGRLFVMPEVEDCGRCGEGAPASS